MKIKQEDIRTRRRRAAQTSWLHMAHNPAGAGNDADAQAYFDQLASPTDAFKTAWNTAVVALKDGGYWDDYLAIYPCPLPATAANFAVNAKNPGTYDITWVSTTAGMFTVNGFDGAGSGYGRTGLVANTVLNLDSHCLDLYINEDTSSGEYFGMGCRSSGPNRFLGIAERWTDDQQYSSSKDTNTAFTNTSNILGHYIMSRRADNDLEAYKNGVSIDTNTDTSTGLLPILEIYLGARNFNDDRESQSIRRYAYWAIGNAGISDAAASAINTIIETYQTALSRGL